MSARHVVPPLWFLALLLAGCGEMVTAPAPTPDPIQAYVDANRSQATAVAAIATADYHTSQLTGTVEAHQQNATQQALALQGTEQSTRLYATEKAWNATTTADAVLATSSAISLAQQAAWTQRAIDITSTADSAAVQAFATQQYAEARNEELALQRAEWMNGVAAVTPWVTLLCFIGLTFLVVLRWSRVRVVQRDPRGDAPLLLNVVDGIAYDADRQPTGAGGLLRQDVQRLPALSANEYLQTTTRDQMVDLKTRGLPGSLPRRAHLLPSPSTTPEDQFPRIEVIQSAQAKPLLHDVLPAVMRDAIDAEIIADPQEGE